MPATSDQSGPAAFAAALNKLTYGDPDERLVVCGAGASVEAGLPTSAELHGLLMQSSDFYRTVAERLQETSDVERIFQAIDSLAFEGPDWGYLHDTLIAAGLKPLDMGL